MKISKSVPIPIILGFNRFKRSKSASFGVFLAILIAITFILGTTIGTKYLQSSIVIRDLDNVLTDINIGVSLPDNSYRPNLNNLSMDLKALPYVNKTFIKYQTRGERWRAGNLTHHMSVDKNDNFTFDNIIFRSKIQLDILGYDNENFKEYVNLLDINLEKENDTLLKTNETIISHYFAQKLNISINDTIYLHYMIMPDIWQVNTSLFNKSFPLIVRNIISISSKSIFARDILRNTFISNNEGTIDTLMILKSETFLKILGYLTGDYGDEFSSHFVISIFLDRESIINSYNLKKSPLLLDSIEKEILGALRVVLPKGTVFYSENILLNELENRESDIRELQRTLLVISAPIVLLVFLITLYLRIITIENQISDYGVLICRGSDKKDIRRSFIIEGGFIGIFASICSIPTCSALASLLYFIIPNDKNFIDWINVFLIVFPSYLINALFLGLLMGVGVNYFASRKLMEIDPISAVQIRHGEMISWAGKHQIKIRKFIVLIGFIGTLWIILQIISLTGFIGMFSEILHRIEDIMSDILLLVPILMILLLIIIVTNRRDIFAKYMVTFSFFLDENVKGIMRSNYLRRPKHFSRLALITAIAFAMGITPIMLSQSAQDVSIRQIKRDVGSDIRITSTYEQLKAINYSTLYSLSSHINAVTPMIWVDSYIVVANGSYKDNGYHSYTEYWTTGVLAIQPENFVEVTYFEDCFTPENESKKLFSQLKSDTATATAQIGLKNIEIDQGEYIEYGIGSVFPVKFNLNGETIYLHFTVIGFFYIIPGLRNFGPPAPLICSIDYLESNLAIPHDSHMTWLIKINPKANRTIRTKTFQIISDQFKDFEVIFVDNVLDSYLFTPIGSIVIIMDSMFFIVLAVALFGLSLTFFQTFSERRTEVAIYRARGMNLGDIRKMFLFEMLSIDSLGAISGVVLGIVTALIYKDVLIRPWPIIPVYLFVPWMKIIPFLFILTMTHILSLFGQSYWSTRSRIIKNLRIRD